ncbi:class I SAM-dependent methyltransferase [Wolbachia endosymbiont of Brugia pahangi]|uniref:class I SAM-dependent methyltransferase n=1 Tax=Wolbachia endosymbiont of Brugia pahangi TaxID=96495 RepID=UPI00143575C1|nr:SAM-dependent methyltransferase [Wolbachia endosymbiont of Brugia pahangi]QIT36543.1 S-adenosyl-L-methionine-dependent methyltransferase family protein [Wolbachia endosymbiont of Brugia pahangi]
MLTYIYELIDKSQGSISISDFMNAALYHKEYGYYMNKLPLGNGGDFITAPEISQLFGEIIAVWVMHTWKKLGKPPKFSLVELGPGRGTLIHDIIRVTKKYGSFFSSMAIHLVEISPTLQKIQKEKLKGLGISWHENIDSLPEQPTIFLANEFFDALPIDQFVYRNGKWHENRVTKQNDGASSQCPFLVTPLLNTRIQKKDPSKLALKSRKKNVVTSLSLSCHPSAPSFLSHCLTLGSRKIDRKQAHYSTFSMKLQKNWIPVSSNGMTEGFDGAVVEVCSAGIEVLKKLEDKIMNNGGAALIIDYGYVYPSHKSTLQSVRQHKYANFLENVGNSDITALVNFQALRDSLRYVDCEISTQREFLYLFGIKERTQALMENASDEQKNRIFSEFLRLTENMGTLFKAILIHHS